ncbi:hypothetical protein [Sphingomonas colocasiae]|uniref:RNA polymerase sigma factor 70 region 4 type 2 domain-containing protein n=1 Tax=Sphingomonas colocasiae TaxID=1848973 RepID=A0ABS7PIE0_9SPHN|nr:hypothetical protein [Sphingomonas colocasiae]MBY8821066.1 hypothetical protein [Sphingomonas colocasiae]
MAAPPFASPSERRAYVLELRERGMTFKDIAAELGVSTQRARDLYLIARRQKVQPGPLTLDQVIRSSPVALLPLSARTRRALEEGGISTFEDLWRIDRASFSSFYLLLPDGGPKGRDEIFALLDAYARLEPDFII